MKKLFTFLLVSWLCSLASLPAHAQSTDSLRQHLNQLFANVDRSQVPAPFLEEYGLRFLPLDVFNGTLTDSSRTNLQAFRLAYASILTSYITGTNSLLALGDLNNRLTNQLASSTAIPIVVQRIDYASLRPDALTTNLLRVQDGKLYDVPGRLASPYVPRVLFMASPSRSTVPNGDVSFVFTQALHIQSGGGSVQAINLDFGDGQGYRAVSWGQPIGASYCTAGVKRVKVRISYGTSAVYESHFDVEVYQPGCNQTQHQSAARYADGGSVQNFPATSQHSGGKIYIRYGSAGRTQLTRPLIVAEGYDVSSIAPDLQDNYGIEDFLNNIRFTNGFNLSNALENATNSIPGGVTGYDIVFIDYNNGTDDIRRNAALFKEVVAWVNANKNGGTASGEKNVVLGISMGGLVARYGLAQMERTQPNSTHTRLLITHDSPHRGANTPLGLQALTLQANAMMSVQIISGVTSLFGKDIFPELHQAEDLLNASATQQLLLVRATRSGIGQYASFGSQYNSFINSDYQPVVTENPNQPFPYRFIATSLGSQCGNSSLNPHAELVRYTLSGFFSPLPWLVRTSYQTEIIVNALPLPGQIKRLSSLRIFRNVRTLLVINSRTYYTDFAFNSPSNNPVAWDGLPGGTQNVKAQANIHPPTPNFSLLWFASLQGNFYTAGDFCFIPTASALDVPVLNPATTQASYVNNVTSSTSKPTAARYIAQASYTATDGGTKYNYPHPFFPARQAQWLFNEMQGAPNQQACSSECNPVANLVITGPSGLCVGGNGPATYTSPLQGTGYTYTWTASPVSAFTVSSGSGPTFQTANVSGINATGTITLTVNTGCVVSFSKSIKVGTPAPIELQEDLLASDPCAKIAWFNILNYDPQLTYSATGLALVGNGRIRVKGRPGSSSAAFTVTATNSCGSYSTSTAASFPECGYRYATYPNPADDNLTVEQTSSADSKSSAAHSPSAKTTATSTPFTVRLYDTYGILHMQQTTSTAALQLGVNTLPAGLYLLRIEADGKVVESRQLQITH